SILEFDIVLNSIKTKSTLHTFINYFKNRNNIMSVPAECEVLVIGGGPGGSYTAAALAREGVSTVILEADIFPRYHVGESQLASLRPFLKFIDADAKFRNHGFTKKIGAAFKLNHNKREGWTDYIAAGGPEAYTWNVIRSESDELMFRHAGEQGAKIFDGVKVTGIDFVPSEKAEENAPVDPEVADPGRPVSASWSKKDGTTGSIKFKYIVDASGRAGIVSTKYLKNRKYNQGLKNVASWGYWRNSGKYGAGGPRDNQPYFEALTDASGWCWCIPLHDGTMSVGVVMRQDLSTSKKKAMGSPSGVEFYKESLKLAPNCLEILGKDANLSTEIHYASDWSYSAASYASPYVRIVGDAGCFIDPYFSSGVHLALASGLSAAMTICAARKGDCEEYTAAKWHSIKVAEGYTRFLLVVMSAMKQIRGQDEPVLSDWDDDGFDVAFDSFRPIIQGTADADVGGKLTQSEVTRTVDFCLKAFEQTKPEETDAVLKKLEAINGDGNVAAAPKEDLEKFTEDELRILNHIRARQMLRMEDTFNIDNFGKDAIDGFAPNLKRGSLGLVPQTENGRDKLKAPVVNLLRLVDDEPTMAAAVETM
ncbi:Flavine halogenase aclH, partial [Lachnellula suecica]